MAQSENEITNSIGMKLALIPKGSFVMGSPKNEDGRRENEVQHEVTLTKDFYLGITEVTQAQYQKVMGENPSYFQGDKVQGDSSNHSVEQVSWEEAVEFCKRLSALPEERKAGRVYRLPTEAEWEYACRAGTKSAYSFGDKRDSLDDYAWYGEKGDSKTHPVGQKKPNAWGLYDMHGNVWEWCSDWYGDYANGAVSDPVGPREGSLRVRRGGSWNLEAAICRSAYRYWGNPSRRFYYYGFRLALSSPEIPKQAEPEQDK
ncbi:MAG: formylglycine-generating enzyme family protein [Planctomycetota bacterium]